MKNIEVKQVDNPTYEIDPKVYKRFDERKNAFGRVMYDSTAPFFYKGNYCNAPKVIHEGKDAKGYSRIELARACASWTIFNHFTGAFSAEKLDNEITKLSEPQLPRYEIDDMDKFTSQVKETARKFGASLVGVCKLNRNWLYEIDMYGKPVQIPDSFKHVIVMAVQMNDDIFNSPDWSAITSGGISYSQMAALAASVAQFLRHLGYNALSAGNDTALNIPMAIDAGLGEMGRNGMLVNPKIGSTLRLCKIFTDAPLIPDKPIDFSLQYICRNCTLCSDACKVSAISSDAEPSYKVNSVSNNNGIKRWAINADKCYMFWVENGGGCSSCIAVCPFSK
ncbi:MAG TPA: reductive dehalogenase [Candidatus Cloacimonetes bacterium]|nr:reductive dehalogenase [Candidatus Cloacimonadota bacterium]HEX38057.1 reductive dehalogenase [Candidatus Cloacimonadota bacterium]